MLPLAQDRPEMPRGKKRRHSRRHRHFLVAWLRAPLKMGAVVPSSRALARAMAAEVDTHKPGAIIELGAGTGVITHALVQRNISADRLLVLERDRRLHGLLAAHFPELNVVCADAAMLDKVLADQHIRRVNAIVSSLPLLSMPKAARALISEQLLEAIAQGGILVQFTYGARSPIARDLMRRLHITGKRVKTVVANVPPAHIWVYKKA